jgi:transcriptional regulator with XRE-family HTH domain
MKLPCLRLLREACGLSQLALAELSGVSRRTVLRLEAGGEGNLETALKLAGAFGVQWTDLARVPTAEDAEVRAHWSCVQCGQPFALKGRPARYCSNACRERAFRRRFDHERAYQVSSPGTINSPP